MAADLSFPMIEHTMKKNICYWYDVCPVKRFHEDGKLPKMWVKKFCWSDNSRCVRKKFEERGIYHPDNMLPDGTIDESLR